MTSPTGRILAAAVVVLAGVVAACSPPTPVGPDAGSTRTEPGLEAASAPTSDTPRSDDAGAPSSSSPTPSALPSGEPSTDTASSAPPDRDPEPSATSTAGQDDPPEPTAPPTAPSTVSEVVPTVVYAGAGPDSRVRVNGYVPGVVEDGGTCSALLTGSSGTSSASAPAFADAAATWCDELVLDPVDGDVTGWRVVVTYSSPAHQGSSTSTAVSNP